MDKGLKGDSVNRIHSLERINFLEKQGDEITHVIINESASTFIVPFDREDIYQLAVALDEVLDHLNGAAKRLAMYKIYSLPPQIIQLSELILEACVELKKIIGSMRPLQYTIQLQESIKKISDIENRADHLYDEAVGSLFRNETDPLQILKLSEAYSYFTSTTDKAEDAANIIESVLLKFN